MRSGKIAGGEQKEVQHGNEELFSAATARELQGGMDWVRPSCVREDMMWQKGRYGES